MTEWSNEKDFIWGATFVSRLLFSLLLINVAFPWRYSPHPLELKQAEIPAFQKKKVLSGMPLSPRGPPPRSETLSYAPCCFCHTV